MLGLSENLVTKFCFTWPESSTFILPSFTKKLGCHHYFKTAILTYDQSTAMHQDHQSSYAYFTRVTDVDRGLGRLPPTKRRSDLVSQVDKRAFPSPAPTHGTSCFFVILCPVLMKRLRSEDRLACSDADALVTGPTHLTLAHLFYIFDVFHVSLLCS